MPKRNAMEATYLEHTQMLKIIHLKEAVTGDSGEKFGDHMVAQPQDGQKRLNQTDIHDNCVQ